jgi:hypothetical protein
MVAQDLTKEMCELLTLIRVEQQHDPDPLKLILPLQGIHKAPVSTDSIAANTAAPMLQPANFIYRKPIEKKDVATSYSLKNFTNLSNKNENTAAVKRLNSIEQPNINFAASLMKKKSKLDLCPEKVLQCSVTAEPLNRCLKLQKITASQHLENYLQHSITYVHTQSLLAFNLPAYCFSLLYFYVERPFFSAQIRSIYWRFIV